MNHRDSIKYLAVGLRNASTVLLEHFVDEQNRIFAEDYAERVTEILSLQSCEVGVPSALTSPLGQWLHFFDEHGYTFIVLASAQYPSKVLAPLLGDMKTKFYEANPDAASSVLKPHEGNAEFMHVLATKYMNPSEYGTAAPEADQQKLHDFQLKVQESLNRAIAHPASERTLASPLQEESGSNGRRCIRKVIISCFVLAIFLYILVPIIVACS